MCINKKKVCDKEADCKNGEDEEDCKYPEPKVCKQDEFKCSAGTCIPVSRDTFVIKFFSMFYKNYIFQNVTFLAPLGLRWRTRLFRR